MFSAVGIKIVAHYCGGELEKIALFSKPTSCCGEEEDSEMAKDDSCCHNDSKHIAFNSDFTFFTFVSDCKASITNLFIIPNQQECLSLTQIIYSDFLINKKYYPPYRIQDDIISISNLRI